MTESSIDLDEIRRGHKIEFDADEAANGEGRVTEIVTAVKRNMPDRDGSTYDAVELSGAPFNHLRESWLKARNAEVVGHVEDDVDGANHDDRSDYERMVQNNSDRYPL